jgi:hypothetical protein
LPDFGHRCSDGISIIFHTDKEIPLKKKNEEKSLSVYERMNTLERKIWNRMINYNEQYFYDMQFRPRQLQRFLTHWEYDENGKPVACVDDLPGCEDMVLVSWTIKLVKRPKGYLGKCEKRNKLIRLKANLSRQELKYVILHELIHVYEFTLWERYRQILCIYFFKKLSRRIGERKLFELVHMDEFAYLNRAGYGHNVLFMLKSLDLDLRLGLSLGTIYGYERERYFNPEASED